MTTHGPRPDRAAWLAERRRNSMERFDRRFSADYDAHWGEIFPSHARMLDRFLDACPPGCEILDAACGTGRFWPAILASGRRPRGIDQSEGMLRVAARKFPDVPTERRALTDLDAKAAYDGILCMDAMEYVPPEEWPAVLGAFRRALRPGGHLYLTVEQIDPDELEAESRRSRAAGHPVVAGESVVGSAPEEDDGYHYFPTDDQVFGWLAAAGLETVEQARGDDYLHLLLRRA